MIIKPYEIRKNDFTQYKIFLFYGKNNGQKKEVLEIILDKQIKTHIYDENEILNNENIFFDNIFSKSLFDNKKTIIIKRTTDKIISIIEKTDIGKIEDTKIILIAENLEKKSKLRSKFEKNKKLVCIPFYPDNEQTLLKLARSYVSSRNIVMSSSNINMIVNKSNNDREILMNELNKIELYCLNGKKINNEKISKLINLVENHSISELVDNYLAKNEKKVASILNDNNFYNEDCIIITRTFLNKLKKLLKLSDEFLKNNNIELTISSAKPPIFWKDKEITKQQIYNWSPEKIRILINRLNDLELNIKKNINIAINLTLDFILDKKNLTFSN